MQTINRQTVDAMKNDHPFAAGALAASLGMSRDGYGCHFGMRSTNDHCRAEFVKGWNACEGVKS
jgi:hypothetical protein